ncbi:MAG: membrane protein insertion efficiency factor YidD [Caedimonas sp.]|nr:membrane protein insertion efficiency factor YidD [Caedimonas sp.]
MHKKVLKLLFWVYKKSISPFLPCACRFFPTCSEYAYIATQRHGVWKGGWLTLKRLAKCHPWGHAGIDYPPDVLS